jgi:copper chaperone CopZ
MTTTMMAEGTSCEHHKQTTEKILQDVAGVSDACADRETDSATIKGDPDSAALVQAAADAGYEASV